MKLKITDVRMPENVRPINEEHVDNLAGSMRLIGQVSPVVVAEDPDGTGWVLVAGFHRLAAAAAAGLTEVEAVQREADLSDIDRAVENIVRVDLTPAEEAEAIKRALDGGLTPQGAAQALGMSVQLLHNRMQLLDLPEHVRAHVGVEWPLALLPVLLKIQAASTALFDDVCEALLEGGPDDWNVGRELARNPDWVLSRIVNRHVDSEGLKSRSAPFLVRLGGLDISDLHTIVSQDGAGWKDAYGFTVRKPVRGKAAVVLAWHSGDDEIRSYRTYGALIEPTQDEVDALNAIGALLDFEGGNQQPFIVERDALKILVEGMIERAHADGPPVREKPKAKAKGERKERTPREELKLEHGRAMRELADQAHGVNLDLGQSLIDGLSKVDVSMDVARFFAWTVLGTESSYMGDSDLDRIAREGVRLCLAEFREDVTPTKKDGTKGKRKISYGAKGDVAATVEAPRDWLWKYVGAGKTPEELFGRTLAVIAMQRYAFQEVVSKSQQGRPITWPSRGAIADKTLAKLVKPHLPASWKGLDKALTKAYDQWLEADRAAAAEALKNVVPADEIRQPVDPQDPDLIDEDGDVVLDGDADQPIYTQEATKS